MDVSVAPAAATAGTRPSSLRRRAGESSLGLQHPNAKKGLTYNHQVLGCVHIQRIDDRRLPIMLGVHVAKNPAYLEGPEHVLRNQHSCPLSPSPLMGHLGPAWGPLAGPPEV